MDSTAGIVAIAAAGVAIVALALALATMLRISRLRRAQREVLGEGSASDLVAHGVETRRLVEELDAGIGELAKALFERMDTAEERLDGAVSRTAVLRYDAFNESTGRQSSSVALLDSRRNGVVISAILQRDQARVYAKPIVGGSSELELSPEELEAIRLAEENAGPVRVSYLGPTGTYNEEALLASAAGRPLELAPQATIFDAVNAVERGEVERGFVPFENSIEGSVRSTLDAIAFDTSRVASQASSTTRSATT